MNGDASGTEGTTADPALEHVWGEYRVWAATSQKKKTWLTTWQRIVLALLVFGAFSGTLSEQCVGWFPALRGSYADRILGGLGGACILASAFFTRQILNSKQHRDWVRSRSAAETFKSEAYRYITRVPPYDSENAANSLLRKAEKLRKEVANIEPEIVDESARREKLPPSRLSVEEYIEQRPCGQVVEYYDPKSRESKAALRRWRNVSLSLGVLAVVLGVAQNASAYIALVSTITAATGAYVLSARHDYLLMTYQGTATRLRSLVAEWRASNRSDADQLERNKFIRACESAISAENESWKSKFFGKEPSTTSLA